MNQQAVTAGHPDKMVQPNEDIQKVSSNVVYGNSKSVNSFFADKPND
jgi:hypothetical protein